MKDPITFSEKHWATPAADMVNEFIKLNQLNDDIDFDSVKTPSDSVIPRVTINNPASTVESESVAEDKPVFTQEALKAHQLPPVGCECELKYDHPSGSAEFPAGTRVYIGGHANFGTDGAAASDVAVFIAVGTHNTSTGASGRFVPIDNRTDEEKMKCALWDCIEQNDGDLNESSIDAFRSNLLSLFTITLNK